MLQFLFGFQGRVRRSHFFFASLGVGLLACVLTAGAFAALNVDISRGADGWNWDIDPSPLSAALIFAVWCVAFWSMLAVTVKRWHDVGVTGWFSILSLPMITHGAVFLLLCLLPGTTGPNSYGSDPRGRTSPMAPGIPVSA